jgi:hypothetical protein
MTAEHRDLTILPKNGRGCEWLLKANLSVHSGAMRQTAIEKSKLRKAEIGVMRAKIRMLVGETVVSWGGYPYHPVSEKRLVAGNDTRGFAVIQGGMNDKLTQDLGTSVKSA